MFGDDRYYEFMCFDVSKVVRSPGFDYGHDDESQNGRDIKIDILDDYILTPEVFRVIWEKTGVPGGLPEPPGRVLGLMGLSANRGGAARAGRAPPPPLVRIGLGRGGAAPLSFSTKARGGSPTPDGSRTPPGAPLGGGPHLSPPSSIYGGRGAP